MFVYEHISIVDAPNDAVDRPFHPVPISRRQLPWNVFRATVRAIAGGEAARPIVRKALPLIFLLSCCHALGETVGILAGPGNSPTRLR